MPKNIEFNKLSGLYLYKCTEACERVCDVISALMEIWLDHLGGFYNIRLTSSEDPHNVFNLIKIL